jgi:hypothetical protein
MTFYTIVHHQVIDSGPASTSRPETNLCCRAMALAVMDDRRYHHRNNAGCQALFDGARRSFTGGSFIPQIPDRIKLIPILVTHFFPRPVPSLVSKT